MQTKSLGIVKRVRPDNGPVLFGYSPGVKIQSQWLCGWFPRDENSDRFEPGMGVPIICVEDAHGSRRFSPIGVRNGKADEYKPFFNAAHHCGMPILSDLYDFNHDTSQTYRAMWFLFQRAQHMQEYVSRRFHSKKDLRIAVPRGREERIRPNILPWPADRDAVALGYPVTVEALLAMGEGEAARHGIPKPTIAQQIHYGFVAVAKLERNQSLSGEKSRVLIKHVLFDVDPRPPADLTAELKSSIRDQIQHRLWELIEEPLSPLKFDDMFWGKSNTFVKEVAAKVPEIPYGDRLTLVGRVLLEMGFEAFEYLGQCIQAVMQEFADGIEPPLREDERRAFDMLYLAQEFAGGLPPVLLGAKLGFVRGIVHEMIDDGARETAVSTFHRLLHFYYTLVDRRREIDRRASRPDSVRYEFFDPNELPDRSSLGEASVVGDQSIDLRECHAQIRQKHNVHCGCDAPDWDNPEIGKRTRGHVVVIYRCQSCQREIEVKVRHADLRRLLG